MKLLSLVTLAIAPSLVFSKVLPGADTPLFYLVSTSLVGAENLLPLRTSGGSNGGSALTGSGPIGQFYFKQGQFVAVNPDDPTQSSVLNTLISGRPVGAGCTTAGALVFVQGSSTNKCARSDQPFSLHSDPENSQLGASLTLDPGSFYACGPEQEVWYKGPVDDGPGGCNPISLYTVPVPPVAQ
ncbi:hypothetical protein BD779DRAFT_1442999 [Infundibulicybe gibba]|nr:hypothetical protein BD779DRAFT_1442999 [Infundibulicybe gibba]